MSDHGGYMVFEPSTPRGLAVAHARFPNVRSSASTLVPGPSLKSSGVAGARVRTVLTTASKTAV